MYLVVSMSQAHPQEVCLHHFKCSTAVCREDNLLCHLMQLGLRKVKSLLNRCLLLAAVSS